MFLKYFFHLNPTRFAVTDAGYSSEYDMLCYLNSYLVYFSFGNRCTTYCTNSFMF